VATIIPLPRKALSTAELIARRRHLPRVDSRALRDDIDAILDSSL